MRNEDEEKIDITVTFHGNNRRRLKIDDDSTTNYFQYERDFTNVFILTLIRNTEKFKILQIFHILRIWQRESHL